MTATIHTSTLDVDCDSCPARAGERCDGNGFCRSRLRKAAVATRERNAAARAETERARSGRRLLIDTTDGQLDVIAGRK